MVGELVERVEDRVDLGATVSAPRVGRGPDDLVRGDVDAVVHERAAGGLAANEILDRRARGAAERQHDAVDALAAHDAGCATCESERWRLQAVLDRVDAKLAELTALRGRIVDAQEACADGRCLLTARGGRL